LLRDTARDLCADSWLANQITLDLKTVNGKSTLECLPIESKPYVKAAFSIRKSQLPPEMQSLFENVAS
jgi:hypothetical protein